MRYGFAVSRNLAILIGNDDQAVHIGVAWVHYVHTSSYNPLVLFEKRLAMVRLPMVYSCFLLVLMVKRCHSSERWEIKFFTNEVVGSIRMPGRLHIHHILSQTWLQNLNCTNSIDRLSDTVGSVERAIVRWELVTVGCARSGLVRPTLPFRKKCSTAFGHGPTGLLEVSKPQGYPKN